MKAQLQPAISLSTSRKYLKVIAEAPLLPPNCILQTIWITSVAIWKLHQSRLTYFPLLLQRKKDQQGEK